MMTVGYFFSFWFEFTKTLLVIQLILFSFTTFPIALAHHRTWKRMMHEDLRATPMRAFEQYRFFFIRYFKWGSIVSLIALTIGSIYIKKFYDGSYVLDDFESLFSLMISIMFIGSFPFVSISFFLIFPTIKGNLLYSLLFSGIYQTIFSAVMGVILIMGCLGIESLISYEDFPLSILDFLIFLPSLFLLIFGIFRFDRTMRKLDQQKVKSD